MPMTVEMRPISSIKVTDRVRDTFGDLRELVDSMRQRGLINPVTIRADGTLIAGERRWRAARELGWTEIACHLWKEDTADEWLAVEIEENTCRAQLTAVEAERAWQKYKELLKPQVPDGRGDADDLRPTDEDHNGADISVLAAKPTGYGATSLKRVAEIRETAEDEEEAEEVRQVAREEMAKLATAPKGKRGSSPVSALDRVRTAKKQATRDAMAPGQRLKSDEPKAKPKAVNWSTRLWDAVGRGLQIRKTAEELELDPDPELSAGDVTKMAELLQEQIRDRQYLRRVLLSISEGRK